MCSRIVWNVPSVCSAEYPGTAGGQRLPPGALAPALHPHEDRVGDVLVAVRRLPHEGERHPRPVEVDALDAHAPFPSAALEVRQPLLAPGLDAFLEVGRLARPLLLGQLALGRPLGGVREAAPHRLARRLHGERR